MLGLYCPPSICMPKSDAITISSSMRTKSAPICDMAAPSETMTRCSPFHDFISRSTRTMRSSRSTRRKETLGSAIADMIFSSASSAIAKLTSVPSSAFHPSDQ